MISSILSLKNYHKAFADANDLAFVYGNAQKLKDKSKSSEDFSYPILHLNRPVIRPSNNEMSNYMNSFFCEVSVLDKYDLSGEPSANDESELVAEDNTLTYIMQLLLQLNHDNKEGKIVFTSYSDIEPVPNTFIDSHVGWKTILKIDFFANDKLC